MRLLLALLLLAPTALAADYNDVTIAAVKKLGGEAALDPALPADARVAVKFKVLTDAVLEKLCKYPQIGSLEADAAEKCTEKGFADLRELPSLTKLIVLKSGLTDRELAEVGRIRALQTLYLGESKVTDAGLAGLKKLGDLKVLDLYDTKVTDKGLAHLKELESLEDLNLAKTKVTDAGLVHLKDLSKLKVLKLNLTGVTPKGIAELEAVLPKLTVRR